MTDTNKPLRRDLPVSEARAELQRHFDSFQGGEYGTGWAKLWEQGDFLPWDRMAPSPALAETLIDHAIVVGRALVDHDGQQRRKKALVPGCGRGVDVLLLESFGYDAVGLEYAEDAVKAAKEYARDHAHDHPVRDDQIGKGSHKFVHGDFYKDDWLEEAGVGHDGKFDLIYDYTVCLILLLVKRHISNLLYSSSVPCSHRCVPHGPTACLNFFVHPRWPT